MVEINRAVKIVLDYLDDDIQSIHDDNIKRFVTETIIHSPKNFWERPSAFHPGHHPDDELGEWGNLKHVKRTIVIAKILAHSEDFSPSAYDTLIAALLIHDLGKYGVDGSWIKIQYDHPTLVRQIAPDNILELETKEKILGLVETHMGRWGDIKPTTKIQCLCHYADCIASKTTLNIPIPDIISTGDIP